MCIRDRIGVLRGDDQRMYFKMITFDMRQIEQNNLKDVYKRQRITSGQLTCLPYFLWWPALLSTMCFTDGCLTGHSSFLSP